MAIDQPDYEDLAKKGVVGAISLYNQTAGAVAGVLVSIFWDAKQDVWTEIRGKVEALVDQKIGALVFDEAMSALEGFKNRIDLWGLKIQEDNKETIRSTFNAIEAIFAGSIEKFRVKGHRVPLLPFFAQAATMYLGILHDVLAHGAEWEMVQANIVGAKERLRSKTREYRTYVDETITEGKRQVKARTAKNNHECQPFRAVNRFERLMTLMARDFAEIWPLFDTTVTHANRVPTREIYSDPLGTCDDSGEITLRAAPTGPITGVSVWATDKICSIEVVYQAEKGPGGVTRTGRMGQGDTGSVLPPRGGKFPVSANNPIVAVNTATGHVIDALQFVFRDGTTTRVFGGSSASYPIEFRGEMLSSIHVNGGSNFYRTADSIVFGFKYDPAAFASVDVLQRLHMASPTPIALDTLIAATGSAVDANELARVAAANRWAQQRESYWQAAAEGRRGG
jgi:hypothetical protein